jgi:hypothetical protein
MNLLTTLPLKPLKRLNARQIKQELSRPLGRLFGFKRLAKL